MNKWIVSIGGASLLTAICFGVGSYVGWFEQGINWLEAFAIWTSMVCTILCNYQSRWNYPFGIVSQVAIFIVLWSIEFYALALFNLYLVFSLAYGFWFWKSDADPTPVTRVAGIKNWIGYAGFGSLVLAIYFGAVYSMEPANFPNISKVDAFIAALSGIAQFLLDRKKIETWMVWFVVNVISIPWLYMTEQYFFSFMYMFFLANVFVGYRAWYTTMEIKS